MDAFQEDKMSLQDLYKEVGWITFKFPDGSKRIVRTTFNEEILRSVLKDKQDNDFYDLEKQVWRKLPSNDKVLIDITRSKPELNEIDEFANRYI